MVWVADPRVISRLAAGLLGRPRSRSRRRPPKEYRIDELASTTGMTTRNIRAYREQGLLQSPRREGRVTLYSDVHVGRLRLIGSLLQRGYTAAHIAEFIDALERGRDLADVVGVEDALLAPWSDEMPTYEPAARVREVLGGQAHVERAEELGMLTADGDRYLVQRPQLLNAFDELQEMGFAVDELLEMQEEIGPLLDQIATVMVSAATRTLLAHPAVRSGDPEQVELLGPILQRMRQLSTRNVHNGFGAAMGDAIEIALGGLVDQMQPDEADGRR